MGNITQEQVNDAIKSFIKEFEEQPYLHRCEHSLHIALYNKLLKQQDSQGIDLKNCEFKKTNYVHKEFPGRKINDSSKKDNQILVDRTPLDIAVLAKEEVSIKDFLEGNVRVDFAIELSLEYGIEHLCWDIFKFITGSNRSIDHKNYIIHLYHKNRAQTYFNESKFDKPKVDLIWNEKWEDVENKPNMMVEWCYYLINLCVNYAKETDPDPEENNYTNILAIVKYFVCKKSTKISKDYDKYLPDEEYIKDVLKNMKFVLEDANKKCPPLTNF